MYGRISVWVSRGRPKIKLGSVKIPVGRPPSIKVSGKKVYNRKKKRYVAKR